MGTFRIYPSKSNTIASGNAFKLLNSSQNQITDLWYGGGVSINNAYKENSISRHLIMFDITGLQSKLNSFEINPEYITSYKLILKNAVPLDRLLEKDNEPNSINKAIAASFDLVTFPINKAWDEGRGYDLVNNHYITNRNVGLITSGYSNWLSASTASSWNEPGVFDNPTASTSNYVTQHFELGSEDIEMNVTGMVRDWVTGGTTNFGLGIAYGRGYELTSGSTRYISSFYTNKTNSAFKPYIEVNYNQVVKDDRHQVTNNRVSRLFLYLFSGNTQVDYYSAGTVSIKTSSNVLVYSGLTPTHHSKGVYYIDIWMSGATKGQKYKDVWTGITINPPYDRQDITQNFEIKDNYYTSNIPDVNSYVITTYGIDNNSILQSGEVFRTYIDTRINYSTNRPFIQFGLEYRLTMNSNMELIPWTQVNSAIIDGCYKSYFDIDTSWLLSNQTYEVTFRINELGTKKILTEKLFFKVINKF